MLKSIKILAYGEEDTIYQLNIPNTEYLKLNNVLHIPFTHKTDNEYLTTFFELYNQLESELVVFFGKTDIKEVRYSEKRLKDGGLFRKLIVKGEKTIWEPQCATLEFTSKVTNYEDKRTINIFNAFIDLSEFVTNALDNLIVATILKDTQLKLTF